MYLISFMRQAVTALVALVPDVETRQRLQRGQGLVEYALILVLVAIVSIVILLALGDQVNELFLESEDSLRCVLENGADCVPGADDGGGGGGG